MWKYGDEGYFRSCGAGYVVERQDNGVNARGFAIVHNGLESKVCRRGSLGVAIALSPLAKRAWDQGGS